MLNNYKQQFCKETPEDTEERLRTAAGLTQDELARRVGTKKSNIGRLENVGADPGWQTLKNMRVPVALRFL
ncbi:MAG: hypothetical protein CSB47_01225 [Proteobacteria bacterium]|nr:MAG: hypothetical protein CSB47_01225 [Pseudomonadota bacterium]